MSGSRRVRVPHPAGTALPHPSTSHSSSNPLRGHFQTLFEVFQTLFEVIFKPSSPSFSSVLSKLQQELEEISPIQPERK